MTERVPGIGMGYDCKLSGIHQQGSAGGGDEKGGCVVAAVE